MDKGNNEFMIKLIALLNKQKSKASIDSDIKELEKVLRKIRLVATLTKGSTKTEINQIIKQMEAQLNQIRLQAKLDGRQLNREIDNALRNVTAKEIRLNLTNGQLKTQIRKAVADVKTYADRNPLYLNINLKKEQLSNQLKTFLNKNTKIKESSYWLDEAEDLQKVINSIANGSDLRDATDRFNVFTSGVKATGYAALSTTDRIKGMLGKVTQIGSYFSLAYIAVNKFTESLGNLKEMDTILTEISKTTDLTMQQLQELGDRSYAIASKYGVLAKNFALSLQEMSRAGFGDGQAEPLAELATLAQSAGALTSELANEYLIASNAAYGYQGNVEKLNALLDSQNQVTNRNAVSMSELAEATKVAANQLSNSNIVENEMTALLGTGIATTKEEGAVVGRAVKAIVMNLQQVKNTDEGLETTEEDLGKVESRLVSLGIQMKETADGVTALRNPIAILKELSEVYNSLPENSAERAGIISDIGGKYRGNVLSSILSNWTTYEKMLGDYENAEGSAMREAQKSADSWEGRLTQLQNSWDSFVNSVTSKDAIKGGISFLDRTIQSFEKLTDTIGAIPVLLTTVNASMSALNKNYGITQLLNGETGEIDIQGNFMGINITAIKEQAKHFHEASEAMTEWNQKLASGVTDIASFGNAVVEGNEQFKAYLQTTSKDAPASLAGYKAYLNAAGVSTDALRLKTVLLTSAMTLGLSVGIQALIKGFAKAADTLNDTVEELQTRINDLTSSIASLQSEYDTLSQKQDLTDAEKRRLDYLEKRLELDRQILEAETKAFHQNKVGTSWIDIIDNDSLRNKRFDEENPFNANSFSNLHGKTNTLLNSYKGNEASGSMKAMEVNLRELEEVYPKLLTKQAEFLENMETAQAGVDNLTGDSKEKAEKALQYWTDQYNAVVGLTNEVGALIGETTEYGDAVSDVEIPEVAPEQPELPSFNPSTFSESISALSELQATYDDFYNDVVDKSDFTFDISDIEKLREAFGSTGEVFEEFEKLATSSSTSVGELQNSFDNVLNSFITSNNMLDGLNSSTRDQIVSQLELQGVMNASEIITDEVALVTEKAAESNMTLANAANEAYISLLDEVNASDQTRSAIYALASAEIMYNNSGLDVSGKIEALHNLAKAYNDTATEALLANAAMSAMSYARNTAAKPYMTGAEYETEYEKAYSSKMNDILDEAYASMQKFSNSTFKLDQSASNVTKTQDRLAKSTGKATDAIKEQTEALEEEKQALEEQKNTMDKLASAISAFYNKKIDKLNDEKDAIEDNIQAWEDLADAINWFLGLKTDELDKFIDKLNDANDALQDELDNMDNILSVVDSVYQEEIDLIQAKIDALDEANDAKEKEIALEEARIALEEARNRKSLLVYQKGIGFTYHVDDKAIKEAESNLADLEAEAESDAIKNALQDQIDKLQEYRDMWSEIPDAYKKAMDELEAMQIFGTDYKSAILNSNEGTINEFKGQYTGTQSEMASNDNQISALEAQKKQIEEIMDFWESATNKWEEDQNRMKLSAFFGSDYETSIMNQSIEKWNEYVTQYANAQQKLSDVEAQIASLERLKSEWEDAANAYEDSQNRALLASFFGSDYDYQLLNNSSVWRQKFVSDYANICDQIAEKEAEISALSESTASNVVTSAGQASDALGGTSNALGGLHQTAESGNSISKYIWGDDDDFLLTSAQSRLIELNRLVGDDMSGTMVDMRDKVKAFVDEYSNLEQTGVVTNELKDSLDALSSSEDYAWGYFGTILDGLATRIGDVSNYTTEVIANTQMISDSMVTLDTALQSVQSSEEGVEKEAVDTVSDVDSKIATAVENVGRLNTALSELETSRSNLERIVAKAEEDTNSIASESYNRILLIRDAMSELVMALTSVELSFMSLIGKMQLLDATTLSNVIAQVGFFDDGTSLCGAVHAVINTINNDLINTALPLLNAQNTDTISTEFNGEADSLLSAIKDVTNALYSEDENCLYARINKLTETVSRVKQVESAFADLEKQVISTFDEVTRLDSKIQSMKDKTITITTRYVTEGKATGTAFTGKGYASGTAFSGKSYLSGSWGLKQDQPKSMIAEIAPEILLRNGEYRLIKEPQMIDLKKGDIVFNHEQTKAILDRGKTSNINRLSELGLKKVEELTLSGKSFLLGTDNNPLKGMENLLKYTPYTLNIPNINHNFQHLDYVKRDTGKKVEISIGDIVVQGVQDTNSLSKAIVRQLPNKILQEIGKL